MAEKEFTIKVATTSDTSGIEDIQTALEDIKSIAEESGNSISESLDDAGASADETTESLEETTSATEELNDALNDVNGGNLDDAGASADGLADSMDNATNSTENLSNAMGVMEGSMLLSASEQIQGISNKSEDMSQELENAQITMGQLSTQTGIAEDKLTGMIDHISNETFPREEAMQYVQALDQAGVSAENLGASATNVDRINDAFHLGADGSQKLTMELGVLGVDLNHTESAFNALAYANKNTLGGMSMYQRYMTRYSGDFKELGYNVDQASVIIAGATQKYGGGRKAIGELNKALKECGSDTRALEEALDLQAGSLDNATALTGEYDGKLMEMANQEIEHKTLTERLGAVWEDVSMSLAGVLSPLGSVIGLVGQIGSFTLGINGIITLAETFGILNKATLTTIPSQIAEGVAGWFSIGWVLVAVAIILVLIGVLWYLYNNNETVRNAINNFGETIKWLVGVIYSYFVNGIQIMSSALQNFWNYLTNFCNNFTQILYNTANNGVNNFVNNIKRLPNKIYTELSNTYDYVTKWASELPQKFWDAGVDAVKNFLSALGIASPGTMQRMLIWEISEMGRRVPLEGEDLLRNVNELGSNVVDEFGNPTFSTNSLLDNNLNISNNDGLGNNFNIEINIGSVDNDDRVDEIVEAVRKALAWSNTTAGRTV